MEKMKKENISIVGKIKNKVNKGMKYLSEKKIQAIMLMYGLFYPMNSVSAADAKWSSVIDFILPWIDRLGGVVILIGAVEFGLAFKNDDAEGKTKGMRTVIAGCIVLAVGLGSSTFLY